MSRLFVWMSAGSLVGASVGGLAIPSPLILRIRPGRPKCSGSWTTSWAIAAIRSIIAEVLVPNSEAMTSALPPYSSTSFADRSEEA